MEPPTIPDNRPYRAQEVAHTTNGINTPTSRNFALNPLRSNSPAGESYKSQVFGQPAIGRPPLAPQQPSTQSRPPSQPLDVHNGSQNGPNNHSSFNVAESGRNNSMDGGSVAESVATLDLGHHSIGQHQSPSRIEKRSSISSNSPDQESVSNLSHDQQSFGNQFLGHHSTGDQPNEYHA